MFSSALGEAMTQGLIASMDPMNAIARDMFTQQAKAAELTYFQKARQFTKELEADLEKAKQANADEKTIDGLRALIDRFSGNL